MPTPIAVLVFALYLVATLGLLVYGLNCYVMLALFARRRHEALGARARMQEKKIPPDSLPVVTTQIAVYNEINVVERIMRATCAMDYPAGKHEIQVLDDSTDETTALAERVAAELRDEGHDIQVLHRTDRVGFKAGALEDGLRQARGELLAVFDADFVPFPDYLMAMAPWFTQNAKLGFAQARWGHLNRRKSLLTRAQAIGIDGHFMVEQIARCWNNLYMNFNGTAGMWRRTAIEQAGGWQWDTLTEDLDLSYRVQFEGWETLYLPDVVVPAELPEDVNAFRGQQFRWAKGSFQTLLKHLPRLLKAPVSRFKKFQAVLHMGGYLVHPLMLALSLLAWPMLSLVSHVRSGTIFFAILALPIALSVVAPSTMYFVSQRTAHRDWVRRIVLLPFLIVVGVGLAISNTKAIIEAAVGRESEFVRTPKRGDREVKHYAIKLPWLAFAEVVLGLYCCYSLAEYAMAGKYAVLPFIAIYAAGFLFVGLLTVSHALGFTD